MEVQLGVGALVMTMLAIARQRISARDATRLVSERSARDARFRALVQNSSDVVIVLDASLRATYVSPAIDGVLGLDSELGVGRTFVEWVAPEDREEAAMQLARVAATPSSHRIAPLPHGARGRHPAHDGDAGNAICSAIPP